MEQDPIRVLVVDDHQVLIDGILAILQPVKDIHVSGFALSGLDALNLLHQDLFDVILLDINMPVMDGIVTCREIVKKYPESRIIALTMHNEFGYIQGMIDQGAQGYLLKSAGKDEIIKAIRNVYEGKTYYAEGVTNILIDGLRRKAHILPRAGNQIKLTNREREILQLIVDGLTTHDIAENLFISVATVETHRKNLLRKLEVKNTAGLVREAYEQKLIK